MSTRIRIEDRIRPLEEDSAVQVLLSPFAYLYERAFEFWLSLYQHNLLKTHSLDVPVISVGNITVGGTGKTPFTQYLASYLRDRRREVGIISRGYGRESREGWLLVSDGARIYHNAKEVGDEPFLLATNLDGIRVVVGRNRFRAGQFAVRELGCDVLILDDGLQHLSLERDLDVALLDSTNPFGNYRAIPAGILREPLAGLSRADLFILTRVDQGRGLDELRQFLTETNPQVPIVEAIHQPLGVSPLDEGEDSGIEVLRGKKVIALSSLGNPHSFEKTLTNLGSFLVRRIRYPDHYPYSPKDLDWVESIMEELRADIVVTTEKDGVRLKGLEPSLPIFLLRVGIQILKGEEALNSVLESTLESRT